MTVIPYGLPCLMDWLIDWLEAAKAANRVSIVKFIEVNVIPDWDNKSILAYKNALACPNHKLPLRGKGIDMAIDVALFFKNKFPVWFIALKR